MKKMFLILVVVIIGSVLIALLERLIDIDFSSVPDWKMVFHTATYMLFGGVLTRVFFKKNQS